MIIGTALGAGVLNGGLGGLFGGARNTPGGEAAACGIPTPFELWSKEAEDNIALTRAIYDGRIKDLEEKQGIYNYFNQKFCEVEKQVYGLQAAKPYEAEILKLSFQLAQQSTDAKFAAAEAFTQSRYVDAVQYARELDCRNIKGVLTLPNSPTVTGFAGASNSCWPVPPVVQA